MATVRHLGFVKFKFLTVGKVKRHILHQRTKFRKDRSNRCGDIAFFDFKMAAAAILDFKNSQFQPSVSCKGVVCVSMQNSIKIGQTVAEIWQFNGFQNVGRPLSWICEIQTFLTVGAVKRPILHHRTKFRKDRSNLCKDIAIFVIFKKAAAAILNVQKF